MKKIFLLPSLLATSLTPFITLASCNKPEEDYYTKVAKTIYNTSIDQFMEIANIPHCSNEEGHTDSLFTIRDYIKTTATSASARNVDSDDAGNVWFDIPATEGYQTYKPIIFQGHMDMVWKAAGEAESWNKWTHPIAKPVKEVKDGVNVMHTENNLTTLGADNGLAVALMLSLAINQNEFNHGPIRCVFTANEENGFPGSEVLGQKATGNVKVIDHDSGYDYLVNLDTGPIGSVVFNSAGGYTGKIHTDAMTIHHGGETPYQLCLLKIYDCVGGHSGTNIGDHRANPIQLVAQGMQKINNEGKLGLASFQAPNASQQSIPTIAYAEFASPATFAEINTALNNWFNNEVKPLYAETEPNIKIEIVDEGKTNDYLIQDQTKKLIDFICACDYGVTEYYETPEEQGVIKCSGNIGPIDAQASGSGYGGIFNFTISGRFQEKTDTDKYKQIYDDKIKEFLVSIGGDVETGMESGCWFPWQEKTDSKIMNKCVEAYNDMDINGKLTRVHGGIECADFLSQNEYLTQVSIGPTNNDEHSVNEELNLDTYLQFAQVVIRLCEKMNW